MSRINLQSRNISWEIRCYNLRCPEGAPSAISQKVVNAIQTALSAPYIGVGNVANSDFREMFPVGSDAL
jgi:hypothetical protein